MQQHTNKMKRTLTLILLGASLQVSASGSLKLSKSQYVERWKGIAVEQMLKHGIPASITLAQGILESASGNSDLALEGNNHFGIKCHGWEGKKMYKDDDAKNECFRVYKEAEDSYRDHSEFLKKYNRYAFLFEYDQTDYKSWAKGLRKAGYATNPKYPQLLIGLIEDLGLNEYDRAGQVELKPAPIAQVLKEEPNKKENTFSFSLSETQKNELGLSFIVAKKGDTYFRLSQAYGVTMRQLYRYNDFDTQKECLEPGDIVYLQPKKRSSLFKKEEVVLDKMLTVNELSQQYGVRAQSIKRLNGFDDESKVIAEGEIVILR